MLLATAQEVPSQPAQPVASPHQLLQNWEARLVQYLELTPAQQAQAKAEFQAVRQSAQPIRQQLKQVRQSMFQAIKANDTAAVAQLSAQEANLRSQIWTMRRTAFARIYSSLTPAQQAKADQIPALLRQMLQRRMERHTAPNKG